MMETALMTRRLKAADPTMVEAPRGPAGSPRVPTASITERRISGAEDPSAMSVKLAIVGFQISIGRTIVFPSLSINSYFFV